MAIITKKTAVIGVLIVAGLIALVKFVWKPMQGDDKAKMTTMNTESTEPTAPVQNAEPSILIEKKMSPDMAAMSVRVQTHYKNPGGGDDVAFVLSVDSNGIVTDAMTEVLAVHPTSKMRQTAFAQEFPAALIGKDLKTLEKVDRIGGSSLTTGSFNASLEQLKAQL